MILFSVFLATFLNIQSTIEKDVILKYSFEIWLLTVDFDLHRAHAVQLGHALDFREGNFAAISKAKLLVVYAGHHARIILKWRKCGLDVTEIFSYDQVTSHTTHIKKKKRETLQCSGNLVHYFC